MEQKVKSYWYELEEMAVMMLNGKKDQKMSSNDRKGMPRSLYWPAPDSVRTL